MGGAIRRQNVSLGGMEGPAFFGWLLTSCDSFLDIVHKTLIQYRGGAAALRQCDAPGKQPTFHLRRTDDSHGPMVLLHDFDHTANAH